MIGEHGIHTNTLTLFLQFLNCALDDLTDVPLKHQSKNGFDVCDQRKFHADRLLHKTNYVEFLCVIFYILSSIMFTIHLCDK